MELAGFTEPILKTRQRRGITVNICKPNGSKNKMRFCDAITTHTMRRTAITNLLSCGVNEQVVRKISGHAVNSKEFYRYVSFAQGYIDDQIDMAHEKMSKRQLEFV